MPTCSYEHRRHACFNTLRRKQALDRALKDNKNILFANDCYAGGV